MSTPAEVTPLPTAAVPLSDAEAANPSRLMVGLVAGAMVVVLDFFVVLACLPTIQQAMGATSAQIQWVMAAHAAANGSFLILGGRLGDLLGRRRVFLWGLCAFSASALACSLASSPTELIVFRALQGLSGALLQPQVLGLMSINFEGGQRQQAFGRYGAGMGLAGIGAQLLAGSLLQWLPLDTGWRACFLLSTPLCLLAAWGALRAVEGTRSSARGVDLIGALLLAATLGCLGGFLTVIREADPAQAALLLLAATLCCALVFGAWLRLGRLSGAARIIPAGVLSTNEFSFWLTKIILFYGGVASLYFVLALELRTEAGFSPMQVGLYFALLGACFAVTSSAVRLRRHLAERWAWVGILVLLCGHTLMLSASVQHTPLSQALLFVLSCAAQGTGIGLMLAPLMEQTIARTAEGAVSVGSGMAASAQQMGNSMGICLIGLAYFGADSSWAPGLPLHGLLGAVAYLDLLLVCLAMMFVLRRSRPRLAATD